jgi:hypothetical protein
MDFKMPDIYWGRQCNWPSSFSCFLMAGIFFSYHHAANENIYSRDTVRGLKTDWSFWRWGSSAAGAKGLALVALASLGPQLPVYAISLFFVEYYHFRTIYKRPHTVTLCQFSCVSLISKLIGLSAVVVLLLLVLGVWWHWIPWLLNFQYMKFHFLNGKLLFPLHWEEIDCCNEQV